MAALGEKMLREAAKIDETEDRRLGRDKRGDELPEPPKDAAPKPTDQMNFTDSDSFICRRLLGPVGRTDS